MSTATPPASASTTPRFGDRAGIAVLAVFVVVSVIEVIGELTSSNAVIWATKPLLMPVLLVWLIGASRRPLAGPLRLLAVGLVFAWLGDLALMGSSDLAFILGILMFLVMQIFYIRAFQRVPGPGLVRAWPVALIPFGLIWLALAIAMLHGSGLKALPALIYGLVLVTMAVAALDLVIRVPQRPGWRVAGGALLFVVSDGLIALTAFAGLTSTPFTSAVVMTTYVVAQAMIVTGFVRAVDGLAADDVPQAG